MGALLSLVLLGASFAVFVSARASLLAVVALLCALLTVYLVVYVAGEDDYRADGTSRWDAYDAHAVTILAIAVGAVVAAVAVLALRRRGSRFVVGALGVIAALVLEAAYLANSLN